MMRRSVPSSDQENSLKKGPWTPEEDGKLVDYIQKHGLGSWRALPRLAGLNRCGKSCRLRWTNYLRPDIKRGKFSDEEEQIIISLHSVIGNKWSAIASRLPGRTDNEIKNYWNTHLKKKLLQMGIDPVTHRPRTDHLNDILANLPLLYALLNTSTTSASFTNINALNRLQSDHVSQLAKIQLLHSILQFLSSTSSSPNVLPVNLLPDNIPQHSDLLQLNKSHQFHVNNCFTTPQHQSNQILSNLQNSEAPQPPPSKLGHEYDYQPSKGSQIFTNNISIDESQFASSSSYADNNIPTPNQLPALVSAPSSMNQMETNKINSNDISDPSSTSTNFEAWGDLIDNEASDSYWKGFLEQASSQPWPISE